MWKMAAPATYGTVPNGRTSVKFKVRPEPMAKTEKTGNLALRAFKDPREQLVLKALRVIEALPALMAPRVSKETVARMGLLAPKDLMASKAPPARTERVSASSEPCQLLMTYPAAGIKATSLLWKMVALATYGMVPSGPMSVKYKVRKDPKELKANKGRSALKGNKALKVPRVYKGFPAPRANKACEEK